MELVRLTLPHLRRTEGSIVNVLNVFARTPEAGTMPSSVARSAGLAFTKALSRELAGDGVRVNALLVGFIKSEQRESRFAAQGVSLDQIYRDALARFGIPQGRVGESEESADAVAFLVSARASYITGTSMNVDGGSVSRREMRPLRFVTLGWAGSTGMPGG